MEGSDDKPQEVLHLDLDKVWTLLSVGIQRAYVFAGLGVNAAYNPALNDFHPPGLFKMSFVPVGAESQIVEFKRDFAIWVCGNALREIIESLEVSLGLVYQVCCIVGGVTGHEQPTPKKSHDFEMTGAAGRLRMIEEEFALTSKHSTYIDTLNRLRNCLTHRRGVVAEKDCNESVPQGLHVRYLRFQAQVQQPNQEPMLISPERVESIVLKEGGSTGY